MAPMNICLAQRPALVIQACSYALGTRTPFGSARMGSSMLPFRQLLPPITCVKVVRSPIPNPSLTPSIIACAASMSLVNWPLKWCLSKLRCASRLSFSRYHHHRLLRRGDYDSSYPLDLTSDSVRAFIATCLIIMMSPTQSSGLSRRVTRSCHCDLHVSKTC